MILDLPAALCVTPSLHHVSWETRKPWKKSKRSFNNGSYMDTGPKRAEKYSTPDPSFQGNRPPPLSKIMPPAMSASCSKTSPLPMSNTCTAGGARFSSQPDSLLGSRCLGSGRVLGFWLFVKQWELNPQSSPHWVSSYAEALKPTVGASVSRIRFWRFLTIVAVEYTPKPYSDY